MQAEILVHEFVGFVPEQLDPGTIYLSLTYATATHLCCCGCGREVVTPLSPTDWKLIFDGETVSLTPSIGNWSFPCQSHYWIRQSRIEWAPMWSRTEIEAGRQEDKERKSQRPEFWTVFTPLLFPLKAIADPTDRCDQSFASRFFKLAPYLADIHIDNAIIVKVAASPHKIKDLISG